MKTDLKNISICLLVFINMLWLYHFAISGNSKMNENVLTNFAVQEMVKELDVSYMEKGEPFIFIYYPLEEHGCKPCIIDETSLLNSLYEGLNINLLVYNQNSYFNINSMLEVEFVEYLNSEFKYSHNWLKTVNTPLNILVNSDGIVIDWFLSEPLNINYTYSKFSLYSHKF